MSEREAFEAWAGESCFYLGRRAGGGYAEPATAYAWTAWQAATREALEGALGRITPIIEEEDGNTGFHEGLKCAAGEIRALIGGDAAEEGGGSAPIDHSTLRRYEGGLDWPVDEPQPGDAFGPDVNPNVRGGDDG